MNPALVSLLRAVAIISTQPSSRASAAAVPISSAGPPPGSARHARHEVAGDASTPSHLNDRSGGGVVRADLRPTSSYIRWLERQLEELDAEIDEGNAADVSRGGGADSDGVGDGRGRSLRRLDGRARPSDIDASTGQREQKADDEELRRRREMIRRQLDEAVDSLRGTSAVYASVTEFQSASGMIQSDGDTAGRHLEQSSRKLEDHNRAIRDFEHYRRFSRHEWALLEGGGYSHGDSIEVEDSAGGRRMQIESPLVGTAWTAVEVAFGDDPDGPGRFTPALPGHPITVTFREGLVSGSTGCNRYHTKAGFSDIESSFNTTFVAGTRMTCNEDGVMEQEGRYTKFLTGGTFFYELGDDGGLVLLSAATRSKGRVVPGEVVARFVPIEEPVEGSTEMDTESGERAAKVTSDSVVAAASSIIEGTSWAATRYYDGSEMTHALPGGTVTLTFDADTLSGNAGCNSYFGGVYDVTDSSFAVGPLAVTEVACDDRGLTSQEGRYLDNFRAGAISYEVLEDGTLELSDSRRTIALYAPRPESADILSGDGHEVARSAHLDSTREEQLEPGSLSPDEGRRLQATGDGRAKKRGGMFNAYQTSPLHQGYGTHYATIWVGTPAQRKSVIIDTGSHFTAFPCKGCDGCGEEHHTDRYFDPEASTTFRALKCDECRAAQCSEGRCVFSQTYTEGSSWHAYESVDKVFVGGKELSSALNPINNSFKTDFLFGCQVKETGLFVTQLADGIMGMSAHPSTLPRAMYEQGKLEHNMFSMCFRRELHVSKQGIVAGMLTLGGIDTRVDFAPMVYARNVASSGWFTVFVKNVYVREGGGQRARSDGPHQRVERINADIYQMNSGKGVIIDSGTTDTYLHQSIATRFERVWEKVTGGKKYSNEPVKMDEKDLLLLPTVLIQMAAYDDVSRPHQVEKIPGLAGDIDPSAPQDVILAIPATHYMEFSPSKGTYTPRIYFTETRGGVIGANAMQGHNVLFDWENKRVGFAESSCEYREESKTVTDEGNVMSVDCRLGAPSLSVSCSDSADLSRCEKGADPNTALDGLEIWTRIVLAPGTAQGQTCEEVSAEQNEENGGGDMEVNCDGKGVCREVRKCVISCANAIAHGTAAGKSALAPIGSCGDITWSACDYTCTQTKLNSVLMNDGKCHEEKSQEETRPCHVQACGRSDPCRVPFVVHAIIKVRGAVASHWTKHAEEIFAEAFAATMNERRRKDVLLQAGDIAVLNASPWRASDDTIFGTKSLDGEDEELGMQLVVEASIFNPDAELPPSKRGREVPLATCHERDLQPLARVARDVHAKLAQGNFVALVVEKMRKDEALGEKTVSPFYYTFEDDALGRQSQVVTSWTIKTDIGKGSAFNPLTSGDLPMDILLLTLLIAIVSYVTWTLRLYNSRKRRSSEMMNVSRRDRDRRRGKYSRVNPGDDNDTIMAIADDNYHDDKSIMTTITEHTAESQGGESVHSLGSLTTYLAKTSAKPYVPKSANRRGSGSRDP